MSKQSTFTGIDIGSSAIRVAIGVKVAGSLRLLGYGEVAARGVKRGQVINPDQVSDCLAAALEQAERMSGKKIGEAVVNVNGNHVLIGQTDTSVDIREEGRISTDDVSQLFDIAAQRSREPNSEILQIFAQGYLVDGFTTKNPVGMQGLMLASTLSLITASAASIEQLDRSLNQLDVYAADRTLTAIAAGQVALTEVQNETGAVIIDVGYYTSNVAVFEDGDLISAKVIPVGSAQITNDLAIGLKLSLQDAETVKQFANILTPTNDVSEKEQLAVDQGGSDEVDPLIVPKALTHDIARARVEELFEMCREFILSHSHIANLAGGVALVGGGVKQQGLAELASEVLDLPVFVVSELVGVSGFASNDDEVQSQAIPAIALMAHHALIVENDIQPAKPAKRKKRFKSSESAGPKTPNIGRSAQPVLKMISSVTGGFVRSIQWVFKRVSGKK